MHLASARPGGRGMTQFVQRLEQRKHHQQQHQTVGLQHPVGQVVRQFVPPGGQQHQRGQHHQQPDDRTGSAPQHAPEPRVTVQKRARVDQRYAQRHRIGPRATALRLVLGLAALEDLQRIGRDVGLQQVGAVQLAQQLQHLVLGRRGIAQLTLGQAPDLVDGAPPVHRRQQQPRRSREAVNLARGRVLQQIPQLPTVAVAVQAGARQQPRPEIGDAVPQAALQWRVGAHRGVNMLKVASRGCHSLRLHRLKVSSSTAPDAASRQSPASIPTADWHGRPPPCPRPPCPAADG